MATLCSILGWESPWTERLGPWFRKESNTTQRLNKTVTTKTLKLGMCLIHLMVSKGTGDGQGGLACYSLWGLRVRHI